MKQSSVVSTVMGMVAVFMALLAPVFASEAHSINQPTYHFAPAKNWMNDPNGLVYYEGEYHLFYQYNPYGDRWGHMSWGHAVSRDLMHWKELPVAIPETNVMAFSGSAVVDWSNSSDFGKDGKPPLVAIFTGYNPATKIQAQYVAYSNDRGRTWKRFGDKPVLDIGSTEFRDPKVFWYAPSRHWAMVVSRGAENKLAIYTSTDLKRWTFASEFGPDGATGANWECPDLFELPVEGHPGETRWVLSVNVGSNMIGGGSGGQYFVGNFDGKRFTLDPSWGKKPVWTDYGADFYANASWNDIPAKDGRRIWIGWADDWRYAQSTPTWPSRGMMSLPRTVILRSTSAGYRIAQEPVREVKMLRRAHRSEKNIRLGAKPVSLPVEGGAVELKLDVDVGSADQIVVALVDEQGYRSLIGINPRIGELFFDRTRSGPHFNDAFPNRHAAPVRVRNGRVKLHIFVDESVVEIYANDGETTLTDRFFRGGGALHWTAAAHNGSASIRSLDAWKMAAVR